MSTPANQITLRCEKADVDLFKQLKTELEARSVIAPKDGEIHRAIYHQGMLVLCGKVGIGGTIRNVDPESILDSEDDLNTHDDLVPDDV